MRLSLGGFSTVITVTRSEYLGDEIAEERRHVKRYKQLRDQAE